MDNFSKKEKKPDSLEKIWEELEEKLNKKEKRKAPKGLFIGIGAGLVFLIGLGVVLLTQNSSQTENPVAENQEEIVVSPSDYMLEPEESTNDKKETFTINSDSLYAENTSPVIIDLPVTEKKTKIKETVRSDYSSPSSSPVAVKETREYIPVKSQNNTVVVKKTTPVVKENKVEATIPPSSKPVQKKIVIASSYPDKNSETKSVLAGSNSDRVPSPVKIQPQRTTEKIEPVEEESKPNHNSSVFMAKNTEKSNHYENSEVKNTTINEVKPSDNNPITVNTISKDIQTKEITSANPVYQNTSAQETNWTEPLKEIFNQISNEAPSLPHIEEEECLFGDHDEDGVCDDWDMELNTPKGVPVDRSGRALNVDSHEFVKLYDSGAKLESSNSALLTSTAFLKEKTNPLYVIDGAQVETDVINYVVSKEINLDDIESISLLKGAAAASLYGSRGSDGAILINTKSGQALKKPIKKAEKKILKKSYKNKETTDFTQQQLAKETKKNQNQQESLISDTDRESNLTPDTDTASLISSELSIDQDSSGSPNSELVKINLQKTSK